MFFGYFGQIKILSKNFFGEKTLHFFEPRKKIWLKLKKYGIYVEKSKSTITFIFKYMAIFNTFLDLKCIKDGF